MILIVNFGSQITQLIARRVRECNVFCIVCLPHEVESYIEQHKPKGIILSGGPGSVFEKDALLISKNIFHAGIPIFGICYGMQVIAHMLGGKVEHAEVGEYGNSYFALSGKKSKICFEAGTVWMSRHDIVTQIPPGFSLSGSSTNAYYAAIENIPQNIYAVQFHPEATHTKVGHNIISRFVLDVCGAEQSWNSEAFLQGSMEYLTHNYDSGNAICAVSGGVDSCVAAVVCRKILEKNLFCVFIDTGLMRQNEADEVVMILSKYLGSSLIHVNAKERFFDALKGVTEPEKKRKIIGGLFIDILEEESEKIDDVRYLVQGTIYSDIIESGASQLSHTIKSHHNVGGLPEHMKLKLLEPLKMLFKDEVRELGTKVDITPSDIKRHPFPGPGLAIRVLGEVTRERVELLQKVDFVMRRELEIRNLSDHIWQAFCVLLPVKSVGVVGDERRYGDVICIRCVNSIDGMTASPYPFKIEDLFEISSIIINEVPEIARVTYDLTSKPPATIEWE